MKLFRNTLGLLLALLTVFPSMGQQRYERALENATEQYHRAVAQDLADGVLDTFRLHPIETVPMLTTRAARQENRGYYDTQVDQHEAELRTRTVNGRKVVVVIVDTGIDADHEALQGHVLKEYRRNFTTDRTDQPGYKFNPHGTHCAGAVVATPPNGSRIGVAGIAAKYNRVSVIDVQTLTQGGSGAYSWIVKGLNYVADIAPELQSEGYQVIVSMSLGGSSPNFALEQAIDRLADRNVYVVAAAGNNGRPEISYPARYENARSVGALDSRLVRAYYSNYGAQQFVTAPGSAIYSTIPDDKYASYNGTSMATPIVAGIVANALCANPDMTIDQVDQIIETKIRDLGNPGYDDEYGYGLPIMGAFLEDIPDQPDNPTDPDPTPEPDPDPVPVHPSPTVTYSDLSGTYSTFWKTSSQGVFEEVDLQFVVSVKSKYHARYVARQANEVFEAYFQRRGFVLRDGDDLNDLGYWIAHFCEMMMPRDYDLDVTIEKVIVTSPEGDQIYLDRPKAGLQLRPLFQAKAISHFQYAA